MDVALENRRFNLNPEPLAQEGNESMNKVVRPLVAVVDQRILTVYRFRLRVAITERGQVRIILPKVGIRCSHICYELLGITLMQIPHRRRQHHDVTRR